MAHNNYPNNNQRLSSMVMPTNNQILQNTYEYELMKLMEQERQSLASNSQQYFPLVDERYSNIQSQTTPQINRRLLSVIKPLRIVIIRHAERADAVLGSDWSKKSFDRSGRYIRFTEHLPDAYEFFSKWFSK
jgi:hypothetical protein